MTVVTFRPRWSAVDLELLEQERRAAARALVAAINRDVASRMQRRAWRRRAAAAWHRARPAVEALLMVMLALASLGCVAGSPGAWLGERDILLFIAGAGVALLLQRIRSSEGQREARLSARLQQLDIDERARRH